MDAVGGQTVVNGVVGLMRDQVATSEHDDAQIAIVIDGGTVAMYFKPGQHLT